jgi:ABC-type uncharacterized transport system substrate-binding protein
MRRREFITLLGGAAAWPLAARAQQAERVRRVGVLVVYGENDPDAQGRVAGLREGLERRGWTEGRNVRIDYRFAAGRADRFAPLAKELVALQPDVILAHSTPIAAALQQESRTIPIVFVGRGFTFGVHHRRKPLSRRQCPPTIRARLPNGFGRSDDDVPLVRLARWPNWA